jgi:hypothetical protein
MKCTRAGCVNEATVYPLILLWAARDAILKHRDKAAEIGCGNLVHCEECSQKTKADDLISDDGWEVICRAFQKNGKAKPRRWSAKLEWKSCEKVATENG